MVISNKLFVLSALALALTACGGGGSGSGGETRSAMPTVQPSGTTGNTNNTGGNKGTTTGNTNQTTTGNTNNNTGNTNNNTGTSGNTSATGNKTDVATAGNTTNSVKAMNFVTDYKGNNEFKMVKPTGTLATELQKALTETNKLRAEKGLKPLVLDEKLSAYAQLRAKETVTLFEHVRPNGQVWHLGVIGTSGENLAAGRGTGAEAVTQWRNSKDGHYEAIINSAYTKVGIGVVHVPNSEYGYYWVQIFGDDKTQSPYAFVDESKAVNTNPLNTVIVNGVSLPASVAAGNWRTLQYKQTETNQDGTKKEITKYQGWVSGYDNSRFGAVKYAIGDNTSVFYQGNETPNSAMPKTGIATYNGQAIVVKNGTVNMGVQSQFNVNFGGKTLNGTLKEGTKTLYNLNADINGSSFASKAGASVETQGAFFGKNAEELGGTFKDNATGTVGAYGAKK